MTKQVKVKMTKQEKYKAKQKVAAKIQLKKDKTKAKKIAQKRLEELKHFTQSFNSEMAKAKREFFESLAKAMSGKDKSIGAAKPKVSA